MLVSKMIPGSDFDGLLTKGLFRQNDAHVQGWKSGKAVRGCGRPSMLRTGLRESVPSDGFGFLLLGDGLGGGDGAEAHEALDRLLAEHVFAVELGHLGI